MQYGSPISIRLQCCHGERSRTICFQMEKGDADRQKDEAGQVNKSNK